MLLLSRHSSRSPSTDGSAEKHFFDFVTIRDLLAVVSLWVKVTPQTGDLCKNFVVCGRGQTRRRDCVWSRSQLELMSLWPSLISVKSSWEVAVLPRRHTCVINVIPEGNEPNWGDRYSDYGYPWYTLLIGVFSFSALVVYLSQAVQTSYQILQPSHARLIALS